MSRPRAVSLPLPFAPPAPPAALVELPRAAPAAPSDRDPWSVLTWAAQRTGARYVGVEPDAGGEPIFVRRMLLVAARRALRPFRAELRCSVGEVRGTGAIRFSWHGGRGGLVLVTRTLGTDAGAGVRQPDNTAWFTPIGEYTPFQAPVLWGAIALDGAA